jgi:hypothetical protein
MRVSQPASTTRSSCPPCRFETIPKRSAEFRSSVEEAAVRSMTVIVSPPDGNINGI